MTSPRSREYLLGLVREFGKQAAETEWVERKRNNADPREIGEYVSALSNSAALAGKGSAFVVWGMDDASGEIVGTTFDPRATKKGNEELESWVLRLLEPKIDFRFHDLLLDDGARVVLLEIDAATRHPVRFDGQEWVRVGSYKKKLKDFPERERALWRALDHVSFEKGIAVTQVSSDDVLRLLDYPSYFDLLRLPLPEARAGILAALEADALIQPCTAGGWDITKLGAVLFAKRLDTFDLLTRKAMRVIRYRGNNRVETIREQVGNKGYATGFEGLIEYVNGLLPSNEVIEQALRRTVPMYPELAIREIVANALVHQDFFIQGAGPMVEIFDDRMEVTNPGAPLVDTARFLDTPPRSRNERLASLMRRLGICEERGSGVDKIVFQAELYQLPAPSFETAGEATRVVLLAPRTLAKMDREDRIRACYLHACLKYVSREFLTNASVRERFGIESQNAARASRLIQEAVQAGQIVPYERGTAPKHRKYVPWWAVGSERPPAADSST